MSEQYDSLNESDQIVDIPRYKIDMTSLKMIRDLIDLVLSGRHIGSDIQKDIILAQRGLNLIVDEMINEATN